MDYFRLINLEREPFSNSPDPQFFFQTRMHRECLQKLELALRLRRGLNVVVGEVGTGKTTLCRQLIQRFTAEAEVVTHLILDPDIESPRHLLAELAGMFSGEAPGPEAGLWDLKEIIKRALLAQTVEAGRTVVLIVDEGQKLPGFGLELLRELLNYETNDAKLLQIVIFAQREFEDVLAEHVNFADRINLLHRLGPLKIGDTRRLIRYRLSCANEAGQVPRLFSQAALWRIHRASGGYPRQIIHLCHRSLMLMIVQGRRRVGWRQVRATERQGKLGHRRRSRPAAAVGLALTGAALILVAILARQPLVDLMPPDGISRTEPVVRSLPVARQGTATAVASTRAGSGPAPTGGGSVTAVKAPSPVSDSAAALPKRVQPAPVEPASVGTPPVAAKGGPDNAADDTLAVAAVPAVAPLGQPEAAAIRPAQPAVLGVAALQRGEWLSWFCVKVYGFYDQDLWRSLSALNPRLSDPNDIQAGTRITLPARPLAVAMPQSPVFWVRLARTPRLEDALTLLRFNASDAPLLRLIPTWHPSQGMQFDVVLWRTLTSRVDAEALIESLPASLRPAAGLWTGWPGGTVFFANPLPKLGA